MIGTPRPYRIGWWTHRWWPRPAMVRGAITGRQPDGQRAPRAVYLSAILRDLQLLRRPHRPWQAEWDGLRFARRAFTAAGAARKVTFDVLHEELYGTRSPHQQRRWQSRSSRKVMADIARDPA